ncbi:AP2-associated protein kinase 1-like [Oscarella lobularis]|uniref:AP2-associated protein kinase 1-like n=1 Tax=Oscarella lobularis TaxID=121494 RepID=UPI003313422A
MSSSAGEAYIGRSFAFRKSGRHVVVQSVIGEGGFAFVFLVACQSNHRYALKRMCVNNPTDLANCRREINIVKLYAGHKNAVNYVDSDEMITGPGITEVLLLMDYCSGGHLVQQMNKRIGTGFREAEILRIFSDVCEAVAKLHHRKPAIVHRDLKVENVLLGETGDYKLCDFGSATTLVVNPKDDGVTHVEDELQKFTTLAYRAPEMVDLYSGKLISSKADIWALGCLLYKLCFFTNPFGESILSICNGSFSFPEDSKYSSHLHSLIAYMLEPNPSKRPNIYQVAYFTFKMRALASPVPNYTNSPVPQHLPKVGQVVRPPSSKVNNKRTAGLVVPTSTSLAPRERPRASPIPQRRNPAAAPTHKHSASGLPLDKARHLAPSAPNPPLQTTRSVPTNLSQLASDKPKTPTSGTLIEIDGPCDPFGFQPFNPTATPTAGAAAAATPESPDLFGATPFISKAESKDLFDSKPFIAKKTPKPTDCFGAVPFVQQHQQQQQQQDLDPFGAAPFDLTAINSSSASAGSSLYSSPVASPVALPPYRGFDDAFAEKPSTLSLRQPRPKAPVQYQSNTAPTTPVGSSYHVTKSASLNAISAVYSKRDKHLSAPLEEVEHYGEISSPETLRQLLGPPSSSGSSVTTSPVRSPSPPKATARRLPFPRLRLDRGLSGSLQDVATVIGNPAATPDPPGGGGSGGGGGAAGHLLPPGGSLKKSRSQDFFVLGTEV